MKCNTAIIGVLLLFSAVIGATFPLHIFPQSVQGELVFVEPFETNVMDSGWDIIDNGGAVAEILGPIAPGVDGGSAVEISVNTPSDVSLNHVQFYNESIPLPENSTQYDWRVTFWIRTETAPFTIRTILAMGESPWSGVDVDYIVETAGQWEFVDVILDASDFLTTDPLLLTLHMGNSGDSNGDNEIWIDDLKLYLLSPMEMPTPTQEPAPSPVQTVSACEPGYDLVYIFHCKSQDEYIEIPGGYVVGAPGGLVEVTTIPDDPDSASDMRGVKITASPGEISFLQFDTVDIGNDMAFIRAYVQSAGSGAQVALASLDGSMDRSIATVIPNDSAIFKDRYHCMPLIFDPPGTSVAPVFQVANSGVNDVILYLDRVEVYRILEDGYVPSAFLRGNMLGPIPTNTPVIAPTEIPTVPPIQTPTDTITPVPPEVAVNKIAGCQIFPANNIWNARVDHLPVDSRSDAYIESIGPNTGLHPDFGSGTWADAPIGIPYIDVPGDQPLVPVTFEYADESDPGPYPIPADPPIEGGPDSAGDRHILMIDRDNCILYELYSTYPNNDGTWRAGSGAIFDLQSNVLRPDGWTSADAAGLPILPGLARYEEVEAGEITHALRFTCARTRRDYVWPARHFASQRTDLSIPPMGQRFRLKSSFDVSSYSYQIQVILNALKKYGMILADNGSDWYISGAPHEGWDNDQLVSELRTVHGSNFEAVDVSSVIVDYDSGEVVAP